MLETAMILPWLFIIIFGITQFGTYLYTQSVVHYAAFMSARSYLVYGDKKLSEIAYPFNGQWKIADATARKIIFDSLPWELKRIEERKPEYPYRARFTDGTGSNAAVRVNYSKSGGDIIAEVTYCMPSILVKPQFFIGNKFNNPCFSVNLPKSAKNYVGLPIVQKSKILDFK